MTTPVVVGIEMGYGHLRAALPLAERLGTDVLHADRPPLADAREQQLWAQSRRTYELWSRVSQLPFIGAPLRSALDSLTFIPPLHPYRDLSAPNRSTLLVDRMGQRGLGRGLAEYLRSTGRPLLSTFFTPAVLADRAGCERVHCVVTDSDINRVWAPLESRRTRIRYYAPSMRVVRRLAAYGVPAEQVLLTGFPLPHELVGGRELPLLRRNLARRLGRLDPRGVFRREHEAELLQQLGAPVTDDAAPPQVTFAVGGAGAQAELAQQFLPDLAGAIRGGRLRLTLVAGVRPEVAAAFRRAMLRAGLERTPGIEVLLEPDLPRYFERFHALLGDTDVLWTKPSEMTFFAALGLPLVIAPPMGVHERYNRRWAVESGAGLLQRDVRFAAEWIDAWLSDGTLAGAAWAGFRRLPKQGLYNIVDAIGETNGSAS
jgi:hypothetical protein